MRRVRLFVVAGIVTATLGFAAPSASACPPDGYCPPCGDEKVDALYRKLTGKPLFNCPM